MKWDEVEISGESIHSHTLPAAHLLPVLVTLFVHRKQWCYFALRPKLRDCTDIHPTIMGALIGIDLR